MHMFVCTNIKTMDLLEFNGYIPKDIREYGPINKSPHGSIWPVFA